VSPVQTSACFFQKTPIFQIILDFEIKTLFPSRNSNMDVYSHEPIGLEGYIVRVEVDIRRGIPGMDLVGLAATAVRESRERVRAAVRNSGYEFPQDRLLINLSPADLPKEGAAYDLPIAIKILSEAGGLPDSGNSILALGELTLDGYVKPVRGVLPGILAARDKGISCCIVPEENYQEARMVDRVNSIPISHLSDLQEILVDLREGRPYRNSNVPGIEGRKASTEPGQDFADFKGNESLIRALLVAAAGRHNILLFGPPGSGKTMAAIRFVSLLPDLDEDNSIVVRSLYSLLESVDIGRIVSKRPPFRAPHHSASMEGMIGGGKPLKPGEISLAHKGVLFLDETPEFRRDVLQSLREPSENGFVRITRAGRAIQYPSDFQLIMAANPCPCGNLGNPRKTCVCAPQEVQRYWKKLGGPLLDRIDMRIPLCAPSVFELLEGNTHDQKTLRLQVSSAIGKQVKRNSIYGFLSNSRIPPALISSLCNLDDNARKAFDVSVGMLGISARACHSVLKVARTIADLACADTISEKMIMEAISYRQFGEGDNYWP
jgi:magnesium chelatase family protein